ncbi:hypothetical protein HHI36_000166 [Cryptolaemus montrouzieri]|uniref:Uncharacterized protein n=1 Tax=Cryptolaemus montrouzieri TaxID=559131 RepID=A0ABD2P3V4_9CUCU
MKAFIPKKNGETKSFPVWFDKNSIELIHSKKKGHAKHKSTNSLADYKSFRELRNRLSKIAADIRSDPQSLWRYINSMKSSGKSPRPMFLGNRSSEDNGEIASLFAEFFSEVFTSDHIVSPNFNIPEVLFC